MDYTLILNGLDELKERLGAESRQQWQEVGRSVEHLPGRLRRKLLEELEEKSALVRFPLALNEREVFHTWRRFQTLAGVWLSDAARAETLSFQQDLNRALALAAERLYPLAVSADCFTQYVLNAHGIQFGADEMMSLVDLIGQYWQVRQDGGLSLNYTHVYVGLHESILGLQEFVEKIHALEPPAPVGPAAGEELRDQFVAALRSLIDTHFGRSHDSVKAACETLCSQLYRGLAFFPEGYMMWLHSINETVKDGGRGEGIEGQPAAPAGSLAPHAPPLRHTQLT